MPASSAAASSSRKRKTDTAAPEPPPSEAPPLPETSPPPTNPPEPRVKKPRKKKAADDDTDTTISTTTVATTTMTTTAAPTDKKKPRKKKDKKPSARTPSSYVLFSMEHRKMVIEKNPDLKKKMGEVSKMCGTAWKELSDSDKTPWVTKADALKSKRREMLAEAALNEPPKKKRTPSSYLLFAMERRKAILQNQPALSIGDVSKLCGSDWKAMNDAEKKVWIDKADRLKETAAA